MTLETVGKPSALVENIVHRTLQIGSDDSVNIEVAAHTIDIGREIALECRRAGADTHTYYFDEELWFNSIKTLPIEWLKESSRLHEAIIEASTASISASALSDPTILRQIPPDRTAANSTGGSKISDKIEERKLRSVFLMQALATPGRATAYGFDLAKWKQTLEEASSTDLAALAQKGKELGLILEEAEELRLQSPNGSDLRFSVSGRQVRINDGIIDENDMKEGAYYVNIPAGEDFVTILEDSAEGTLVQDQPLTYKGSLIEGIKLTFQGGKVQSLTGGKNFEMLKADYEATSGDKDRIADLTVGVNPKAAYGFLINSIVSGAVTLGIGDNHSEGGRNNSNFHLTLTSGNATLTADGKEFLKNGRLVP
jgi:leucyl aminopeptidase (aminopeptidase T)